MNPGLLKCTCAAVLATLPGWGLYVGRPVLVPIAFGIIATYVVFGLANLLRRVPYLGARLRDGLRHAIAATLMLFTVYLSVDLLLSERDRPMAVAPKYEATLLVLFTKFAALLHIETEANWAAIRRDLLASVNVQAIITATLSSVSSLLAAIIVVLLYATFFLIEHAKYRRKLVNFAGDSTRIVSVIDEINSKIGVYLAMKTLLGAILHRELDLHAARRTRIRGALGGAGRPTELHPVCGLVDLGRGADAARRAAVRSVERGDRAVHLAHARELRGRPSPRPVADGRLTEPEPRGDPDQWGGVVVDPGHRGRLPRSADHRRPGHCVFHVRIDTSFRSFPDER
ncbi:hypothetical protein OKW27_005036 [Paraburkholderia sp. 35.1]